MCAPARLCAADADQTGDLMRIVLAAAVTALVGTAGLALADGGAPPAPTPRVEARAPQTQQMELVIDTAAPVRLSGDAAGVVIGNPAIAGVSVQSGRLLFVTGRSYGSTSLTVVDSSGATLYHGRVTVIPDETGAVMVTRGTDTSRLSCNPVCRPAPDIGDGEETFTRAMGQVGARSGQAQGGAE